MGENTVTNLELHILGTIVLFVFSVVLLIITVKGVFNVHLFVCINRILEINTFQLIVSII